MLLVEDNSVFLYFQLVLYFAFNCKFSMKCAVAAASLYKYVFL